MTDHVATKPILSTPTKILELEHLNTASLKKLISGQVLAIRVPEFANATTSARLIQAIDDTATLNTMVMKPMKRGASFSTSMVCIAGAPRSTPRTARPPAVTPKKNIMQTRPVCAALSTASVRRKNRPFNS